MAARGHAGVSSNIGCSTRMVDADNTVNQRTEARTHPSAHNHLRTHRNRKMYTRATLPETHSDDGGVIGRLVGQEAVGGHPLHQR